MSEQDIQEQPQSEAAQAPKKTGSGYRRLQNRHRNLIADHETLRQSYQELFNHQDAIRG